MSTIGKDINGSGTVTYTCGLHEDHGKVVVTASSSSVIPKKCQVALYGNPIGSDPNKGYEDYWWVEDAPKTTKYTWGTGWYVGVSIKDERTGNYVLVASAGPT